MGARRFLPLVLIAALLVLPAKAAGWAEAPHTRARLVAGGAVEADALAGRTHLPAPLLLAGLEIRLDPGWKTYWRAPGDGIAPQFDWSGSQNVAATEVLWPAPDHFRDAAGAYNGYADRVILPVVVAPARPGAPVRLALKLDFAVCKDICIPVSKQFSATLSPEHPPGRQAVRAALRRTPVRADGQARCGALRFEDVRARLDDAPPRLEVTIAHPLGAGPEDLFVEAETGQFMPHPKRHSATPERTMFHLNPSVGGDPRALAGQTLTLTAVAAPQSCEMAWTVE
jgi:DsbC/DsbD-like thiol-disulfide interchange protein